MLKGAVVDEAYLAPSTYNSTFTTPTLSAVLSVTVTELETVFPCPGEMILIVGGVVSLVPTDPKAMVTAR
jgi:hypothetical protein